jgi:hypothetical protein
LKIVVMRREQGTLNWEQTRSFGRFYFSLHITLREAAPRLRFFSVHLLIGSGMLRSTIKYKVEQIGGVVVKVPTR